MKNIAIYLVVIYAMSGYSSATMVSSHIEKVGCHRDKSTCFAYLAEPVPNNANCPVSDNSVRWDGVDSINAEKIYSFLAAQMSGRDIVKSGV